MRAQVGRITPPGDSARTCPFNLSLLNTSTHIMLILLIICGFPRMIRHILLSKACLYLPSQHNPISCFVCQSACCPSIPISLLLLSCIFGVIQRPHPLVNKQFYNSQRYYHLSEVLHYVKLTSSINHHFFNDYDL